MFYVLKDEESRYIHRAATFSGGYYVVYTDNMKYARLWDDEATAVKASKQWNNYLEKTIKKDENHNFRCQFTPSTSWKDFINTNPTKIQVVQVELSETEKRPFPSTSIGIDD